MDIEKMLSNLTLEEKAILMAGFGFWQSQNIERVGLPDIWVSDGPNGLRKQPVDENGDPVWGEGSIEAVTFPAACATTSSFDRGLMKKLGTTLGKECQAENIHVILGPAMNMKRSPLCGRNFEYMSEDPYLAGEMAVSYINGVQAEGVGTSVKHFAANDQEHERMYGSDIVDERTLREIYLPAFEKAVKESQPWTVMCSYNRINGTYSAENKWLLTDVLRKEWGFKGTVVSDWGAVSDRIKGIAAGMDWEMPGNKNVNVKQIMDAVQAYERQQAGEAVAEGTAVLDPADLDQAVRNILTLVDKAYAGQRDGDVFDRDADHKKSVEIARECIILLKNDDHVLPVKKSEKVALIGGFAATPRFQGGGSAHTRPHEVTAALDVCNEYGASVYAKGFSAEEDVFIEQDYKDAMAAAEQADKILVFAGLPDSFESEGYDRTHMRLPASQDMMIERLVETGKPVVVILHNGSPVEMPWRDKVAGIVEAYLGGEGVGRAVMDVLYGIVNPSGHLAETIPVRLEDTPAFLNFPGSEHKVYYGERIYIGYRYYDKKKMEVAFPFGHGLSYTTFAYSNLKVSTKETTAKDGLTVSVDVTNTGELFGKEVVQLYVGDRTGTPDRPVRELKGFEKVALMPGETKTVTFELGERAFQWYSMQQGGWFAANGEYVIAVGSSSRDLRLKERITLTGGREFLPEISADTQIGTILHNPVTREYVLTEMRQILENYIADGDLEQMSPMTEALLRYMPIRGFRNFGGVTNEEIAKHVENLKRVVEEYDRSH